MFPACFGRAASRRNLRAPAGLGAAADLGAPANFRASANFRPSANFRASGCCARVFGSFPGEENVMIKGTTVFLTRFDIANAEQARTWLNDPAVHEWLVNAQLPVSREQERGFYEMTERDWVAGTAYRFEIHVAEDDRFIGICGLDSVDRVHRHAEVGIFIGSLADQNRGFGRDAIVTALRFGFDRLGL